MLKVGHMHFVASVAASIDIATTPERVFDLLHDYERRLTWDPFLREATILDGISKAAIGARTLCVAKWSSGGLGMETEYVSFSRPDVAAVKMTKGPWIFRNFAASIRQKVNADGSTRVTYRFNFELRPIATAMLLRPVVCKLFERETNSRLLALKEYLERPILYLLTGVLLRKQGRLTKDGSLSLLDNGLRLWVD